MVITTMQLPGSDTNDEQMIMYTLMGNADISIAR